MLFLVATLVIGSLPDAGEPSVPAVPFGSARDLIAVGMTKIEVDHLLPREEFGGGVLVGKKGLLVYYSRVKLEIIYVDDKVYRVREKDYDTGRK